MTKDISRLLTQTGKHYIGARLQQGKVLLDSDVNEGAKLGEEDRRRVLIDVLGPKGSPDEGFSIRRPLDTPTTDSDALRVGDVLTAQEIAFNGGTAVPVLPVAVRPGSLYAGGLRFDLDDPEALAFQRDFLQMGQDDAPTIDPGTSFRHLYYLNAWEQIVTPVEDQELGEVMLRGPDSSVRVRRMRRVQVFDASAVEPPTCSEAWAALVDQLETESATFDPRSHELVSNGRLQIAFKAGEAADPCSPVDPFRKRYLGDENQTLRIMLTSNLTYVWALDNATPLFRVKVTGLDPASPPSPITITILNPPTDERNWPFTNRVVELIPFDALLDGGDVPDAGPHFRKVAAEMGVFSRASTTYDPTTQSFTLEATTEVRNELRALVHLWPHAPAADQAVLAEPADANGARFFYMRLWHDAVTADQIQIAVDDDPDGPALGDTGVVPVFQVGAGRAGDFWVATLRTDEPAQVQPFDLLRTGGVPPHGPRHFFAPLALLAADVDTSTPPNATVSMVRDCRPRLRPLTERCPTLTVGDGVHSFGDFTTITEALQNLPVEGGIISVRPGVYAPPISIQGRTNVTIEGCGDATIIESQFDDGPGVIVIDNAKDIHISSMRINAGGEPGIIVMNGSQNVAIDELKVVTGTLAGGVFQPGGTAPFPQVQVNSGAGPVTLNNLRLQPNRQIGLMVTGTANVSIAGLDAVGSTGDDDGFTTPLVFFTDCTGVSLIESTLAGVGQVPLLAQTMSSCELSDLTVSSHVRASPSSFATNLFPAVAIDRVNGARLRRSSLSMENAPSNHAVVEIGGSDIEIEDNEIVAEGGHLADAWGGLQVRGNSESVRIVGNRIRDGYGHGITLGGLIWNSATADQRFATEGPGQGQTEGATGNFSAKGLIENFTELGNEFKPVNAGGIFGITITDNLITQMGTNGISVLTVAGLGNPFVVIPVETLEIARNTIRTNLLHPSNNIPDVFNFPFPTSLGGTHLTMSVLPFGGIVLGMVDALSIKDNIIDSNIADSNIANGVLPTNGIFILDGTELTIENNRIVDNAGRAFDTSVPVRSGVRAGIAVMLAGTDPQTESDLDQILARQGFSGTNGLALRICGNSVRHPEGRALHVVGLGPFQIEGNFFCSLGNQGGDDGVEQFAIGELIYVQNLGGPMERFDLDPNNLP